MFYNNNNKILIREATKKVPPLMARAIRKREGGAGWVGKAPAIKEKELF